MSQTNQATSRSAAKYLAAVIVLALLLAALGVVYWLLTKPPTLGGKEGTADQNYLFSIYGFQGDLLRRPSSVGFDDQGNIHVTDTGKKRVIIFDRNGNYVTSYGEPGTGDLQISQPVDVAVASDGRSYVLDKTLKKMVIFDPTHKAVSGITFPEYPLSVTVREDNVFVTTESGVLIGDLDGNLLTTYVRKGRDKGAFDKPGGVAVGSDGTLYVCDSFNYRVQALGTNGQVKWTYGAPLDPKSAIMNRDPSRKFGFPASIAVDDEDNVYVVDGTNHQIVVLDKDGQFVQTMGDQGHDDGQFYYPDGISYADGRLAIADKMNDRIEVFRVPTAGAPAWRGYLPWLLVPLILIPLLLLLLRRRTRYVVSSDFVAVMASNDRGLQVAEALKRVHAAPDIVTTGRTLDWIKLDWQEQTPAEDEVVGLMRRFDLERSAAEGLAVAASLRGKRVLLTEDERARRSADSLGIPSATFAEVLGTLRDGGSEKTEDAA